jgi:PQQ-like domain
MNRVEPVDLVQWIHPAPTAPESDTLPRLAASSIALFIRYPQTLTAVSRRDGHVLWQREDLTGLGVAAFGDSVIAVLTGGTSVGLRQSTGATLWKRSVPGGGMNVPPVMSGASGVFATRDGTLWAAEGVAGAVRRLASVAQLSDTSAAGIWSLTSTGDTVTAFLQLAAAVGETGDFIVARIHVPSATVLLRHRITRRSDEFPENRRMVVQDSVAVLPISGCALGVNLHTGRRLWTQCLNIAQVALRDGVLRAMSGNGELIRLDPLSGEVRERLPLHVTAPFDLTTCRGDVVFVNGGVALVRSTDRARSVPLGRSTQFDRYIGLVRSDSTLFAYGRQSIMAFDCD